MTSDFLPKIDQTKCIGCELCIRHCPTQALVLIDSLPAVVEPDLCTYSGVCQEICPTEAISLTYEIVFGPARRK